MLPRILVASFIKIPACPHTPRVMLVIYDKMALLREGGPCEQVGELLRVVDLDDDDAGQIRQDVDLNPNATQRGVVPENVES